MGPAPELVIGAAPNAGSAPTAAAARADEPVSERDHPGPLAPYSSQGVGLVLFGNFAACLIIALAGFCGAISGLSPALVIVMAQIGATTDAEGDALFVTTAAALVFGAVATGVCFLPIGRYRLATLVRFVPSRSRAVSWPESGEPCAWPPCP